MEQYLVIFIISIYLSHFNFPSQLELLWFKMKQSFKCGLAADPADESQCVIPATQDAEAGG